jgi:hypothetical protein
VARILVGKRSQRYLLVLIVVSMVVLFKGAVLRNEEDMIGPVQVVMQLWRLPRVIMPASRMWLPRM